MSGPAPLVSVVVPLYNHGPYVQECLDSLLVQPGVRMEVLVLDDGSSDEGGALAESWLQRHASRFERVWFRRQPNSGVSTTLRRLLREARGEFVQPLASDDRMVPATLAPRVAALRASGLAALVGDYVPLRAGATDPVVRCGPRRGGPRFYAWWLLTNWNLASGVLLFRRGSIPYPQGLEVDDRWAALHLASAHQVGYLAGACMVYRLHASNASRTPRPAHALAMAQACRDAAARAPVALRMALRYDAARMRWLARALQGSATARLSFWLLSVPWLAMRVAVRLAGGRPRA